MRLFDEQRDWDDDDMDAEADDSDEEDTVPCPACGREILEDCDHCPACGHWRDEETATPSRQPPWVIATALACLAAALWWTLRRP